MRDNTFVSTLRTMRAQHEAIALHSRAKPGKATMKVRAILIDPFACTVTEVEHDASNHRNIYELISHESMPVDLFTCAYSSMLAEGDAIFVDDEGLMKGCQRFFQFAGYEQVLAGKGLILGSDNRGDTVSAQTSLAVVKSATMFGELLGSRLIQTNEPWVKPTTRGE